MNEGSSLSLLFSWNNPRRCVVYIYIYLLNCPLLFNFGMVICYSNTNKRRCKCRALDTLYPPHNTQSSHLVITTRGHPNYDKRTPSVQGRAKLWEQCIEMTAGLRTMPAFKMCMGFLWVVLYCTDHCPRLLWEYTETFLSFFSFTQGYLNDSQIAIRDKKQLSWVV